MKKILGGAAMILILGGAMGFAASPAKTGTVHVTVLDENGALVQDAPIYIYGEHKTRFVGGQEVPGAMTLVMPAGEYRISSAIVKKTGDYLDRFASHEAHIEVVEGDNTSIILTLRPIDDPTASLMASDLARMGLSSAIAKTY